MKALITGASSGLGRDMARVMSERGYDIIAVARRSDRLEELKAELKTDVEVITCDVTDYKACKMLAERADEVDVFINNAGFGVFGAFCENDLERELKMLDTNVLAMHVLLRFFAEKFRERNSGYILNVASLAAFFPGPLFGAYYASKAYVLRLSQALAEELRQEGSDVSISVLCPGPVHTEFGSVARVNFGKPNNGITLNCAEVAEYAIRKMFDGKSVIIPGKLMKIAAFLRRLLPDKLLAKIAYTIQFNKCTIKP
ncbi:MAG: SDR family oxidoreductase [Clostridia bacterium]|nr:SDR family oxidoreductase [Clostridia bacterium]